LIDLFYEDKIGALPGFQAEQVVVHKTVPEAYGESQFVTAHD
jgi:hypothetical protein